MRAARAPAETHPFLFRFSFSLSPDSLLQDAEEDIHQLRSG